MDLPELAGAAVSILVRTVHVAGRHALEQAPGETKRTLGDPVAEGGHRLFWLLRQDGSPALVQALGDLLAEPDDQDIQATVRVQIRKAIHDNPSLTSEIYDLLSHVPSGVETGGGVNVSGDVNVFIGTVSKGSIVEGIEIPSKRDE